MKMRSSVATPRRLGVSLFSGSGIGDLGFRAAGVSFVSMCELEHDRSALCSLNFPEAQHYAEDIWTAESRIVRETRASLRGRADSVFLLTCTAPCQGMSKNGQGTLLRNIRAGKRPQLDPRNRLILPALDVVRALTPEWVVFENVTEMRNTWIEDADGAPRPILNIIASTLGDDYIGEAYDVEFADYGVPQRRQRLITIYTRNQTARRRFENGVPLIPLPTHSRNGASGLLSWVSVSEATRDFAPLDSGSATRATSNMPFHRVPVLDPKKYEWIRNTPPGQSAFDNQCVNASCRFQGNALHGASKGRDGVNRAHKSTPLFCERCGSLLPRPYTVLSNGKKRIMSGYTSAYRRMAADQPATTLTRNMSYPCSDKKIHPTQNRVLSLAEAMRLQSLDAYGYKWGPIEVHSGRKAEVRLLAPDNLIRLVIGESVPPRFLEMLGQHLIALGGEILPNQLAELQRPEQLSLLGEEGRSA